MKKSKTPIQQAIEQLKQNPEYITRVTEWADYMGYEEESLFRRHFKKAFEKEPKKVLTSIRLERITRDLRQNQCSCFEVARKYGLPDDNALNGWLKRHMSCTPTQVKTMSKEEFHEIWEQTRSEIVE